MDLYFDDNGVAHEVPEYSITVCFDTEAEMDAFSKRLQNMNKYRLHDLRKDPNDLPTKETGYMIKKEGVAQPFVGYWDIGWNCFTDDYDEPICGKIIAWWEIYDLTKEE